MKAMNNIIYLAAFVLILTSCADRHIYQGDRYYESMAYSKAIPHYEKVYYKQPTKELGMKLAESYYKTSDLTAAEAIYERLVSVEKTPGNHYFNYAKVLMANGKYEKAKTILNDYLSVYGDDNIAKMLLSSCNSVDDRYIDTTLYTLEEINTDEFQNSFSVAQYKDEIVFVADEKAFGGRKQYAWTGNSYLDLYHMEKTEDGTWLKPELLKGDINGPFHEGPVTFNEEGTIAYFTRSNYFKRKLEVNEERENNLKIFKAELKDGKWQNLEELPFNSDDYSVGHPSLTPCCNTLYFVSDMPGGYGGTDIYRADIVDGKWSEPENLGPDINTAGNEMFPFIEEDGTLYFSSDAHNSMGGLDVFITYFNGERWVQPENLNYPINSNKDDFSFIIDHETNTGFISSSRSDHDKIYEFKTHDPTFMLYGFAHKKGLKIPVEGVNVEITIEGSGEVIKATSDKDGKFQMKLSPETSYQLACTKEGCFSRMDELSTKGLKFSQDFYADFEVEEIVIDKPIVLENIYYDFDKWNIRPDAAVELNKLVKILKDNPDIEIELGSHTDARGSDKYNQVLSQKRAHSAVKYLISQGISAKRLTWKGYGESKLVNSCTNDANCSEEEHQQNRRTEFKVTKINK